MLHRFDTGANQRCAFHRFGHFTVFNQIRFGRREYKFPGGDIHLTAAKVRRINTVFNGFDDFLRRGFPRQHIGVGHTRHRQVRVRFTATVTRWRYAHQARIQFVLHEAFQNAVFDQHVVLTRCPFVIDGHGTTTVRHCAIIHNGTQF